MGKIFKMLAEARGMATILSLRDDSSEPKVIRSFTVNDSILEWKWKQVIPVAKEIIFSDMYMYFKIRGLNYKRRKRLFIYFVEILH